MGLRESIPGLLKDPMRIKDDVLSVVLELHLDLRRCDEVTKVVVDPVEDGQIGVRTPRPVEIQQDILVSMKMR
jgi:hypothetical protein